LRKWVEAEGIRRLFFGIMVEFQEFGLEGVNQR
jgi:hypothetical protein